MYTYEVAAARATNKLKVRNVRIGQHDSVVDDVEKQTGHGCNRPGGEADQMLYTQVADRQYAKKIVDNNPLKTHPILWRGQLLEGHPYQIGQVIDLDCRSASTDKTEALEHAFGQHQDEPGQLLQINEARGVRLEHSMFPEQNEWLLSGKYLVEYVGTLPEDEIDQHVILKPVSLETRQPRNPSA